MFSILTDSRCGSHLLMTLLDSHPALTCHDEILGNLQGTVDFFSLGDNEGCLVDYPDLLPKFRMKGVLERVKANKVIHLTRDLRERAKSAVFYSQQRSKPGVRRANAWSAAGAAWEETGSYDEARLATIIKSFEQRRDAVLPLLDDVRSSWLEIDYDWLTGGREIKRLSAEKSTVLCEYLGVEPRKLTTPLFKMRKS